MLCGNVRSNNVSNMKVLNNILNFVEQGVGRVDELEGGKGDHPESRFEWQDGRCLPCIMQIMHSAVYNANNIQCRCMMPCIMQI